MYVARCSYSVKRKVTWYLVLFLLQQFDISLFIWLNLSCFCKQKVRKGMNKRQSLDLEGEPDRWEKDAKWEERMKMMNIKNTKFNWKGKYRFHSILFVILSSFLHYFRLSLRKSCQPSGLTDQPSFIDGQLSCQGFVPFFFFFRLFV